MLYVHGFTDYFFQRHLAEAVAGRGYPFYAVDLRGHGRSIDSWTTGGGDTNMVNRLELYDEDLDAAADVIAADGHTGLVLMGHSTGGLITSLYADVRPDRVTAMVLNSPWFDLRGTWFERGPITQAVYVLGRIAPRTVVSTLAAGYGRALQPGLGRRVGLRPAVEAVRRLPRPGRVAGRDPTGPPQDGARAVRAVPGPHCTSDRTGPDDAEAAELLSTDAVLDVAHMLARGPGLGAHVDVSIIEGGAHDLALSPKPARDKYLTTVLDWLDAKV